MPTAYPRGRRQGVRSGEHAESAIGVVGRVEVDSNSKHTFQDVHGRLDVDDSGFSAPSDSCPFHASDITSYR